MDPILILVVIFCCVVAVVRAFFDLKVPAASLPVLPSLPLPIASAVRPGAPPPVIVVIGAGAAGCTAAHVLASSGAAVTLLERGAALGGRAGVLRGRRSRWPLAVPACADAVPSSAALVRHLADAVGLESRLTPANTHLGIYEAGAAAAAGRDALIDYNTWTSLARAGWLSGAERAAAGVGAAACNLRRVRPDWHDPVTLARVPAEGGAAASAAGALRGGPRALAALWAPLCWRFAGCGPEAAPAHLPIALATGGGLSDEHGLDLGVGAVFERLVDDAWWATAAGGGGGVEEEEDESVLPRPLRRGPAAAAAAAAAAAGRGPITVRRGIAARAVRSAAAAAAGGDGAGAGGGGEWAVELSDGTTLQCDGVVVAVPAPAAAELVGALPDGIVPRPVMRAIAGASYAPSVSVVYLLATRAVAGAMAARRPACAALVPADPSACGVAYVAFPSGRADAACAPGVELVTVVLAPAAAAAVVAALGGRGAFPRPPPPPVPDTPPPRGGGGGGAPPPPDFSHARALEWVALNTAWRESGAPSRAGAGDAGGLSPLEREAAACVWGYAAASGLGLPLAYEDVLGVAAHETGRLRGADVTGAGAGRAVDAYAAQKSGGGRSLVFAGDYLASPSVEGAARSGLWAATALRVRPRA